MENPCLVYFFLPAEELPIHQNQNSSLRQFNCNEVAVKPLTDLETCLKTVPGLLPAHLSSWRSRSPTFWTPPCLTVCFPGRLMRDEEPRPCQIQNFQASKSPGPQLLPVTRCSDFHCSRALGMLGCSSAVELTRNWEPGRPETGNFQTLSLLIQRLLWMTFCCFSPAEVRFQWKWDRSGSWSTDSPHKFENLWLSMFKMKTASKTASEPWCIISA